MLILISDGNVSSVGYQINCISFAKLFVVNRKGKLNNAFYIIFTIIKISFIYWPQMTKPTGSMSSFGGNLRQLPPCLEV